MNTNKKILLSLILLGVILVPSLCSAGSDIGTMVTNLAKNLGALGAGLSTISFIVAGIMFLSATGNPSRLTIAKGALIAAVTGIVIISLAGVAQTFVKALFQ